MSIKLAHFNAQQSARAKLNSWADEAMDAISEAYVHSLTGSENIRRSEILVKLTSSIDKGRWLLPNHEHEFFGTNKESAFTGFRQGALDDLVDVYDNLHAAAQLPDSETASKIMKSKRRFASAIQDKLEPRVVEADMEILKAENEQTI